jgi:hypothetical protein
MQVTTSSFALEQLANYLALPPPEQAVVVEVEAF